MPFYLTSFQAKDNMPDVPDLPEGDFMNSEHWPRIKHGPPDKADFLAAQNQTMARSMLKEAKKREAGHKLAVAKKLEVDAGVVAAAKPTTSTAAKQAIDADREYVDNHLTADLKAEVATLTLDYVDGVKAKDLRQTNAVSVVRDDLVGKGARQVQGKMTIQCKQEWDEMVEAPVKLLFFHASKQYAASDHTARA
ncbi:hypothetical protein B0A50_03024 [Salinomyces thailandicus]|uniref:Uncharacterized protein n=1 Tax=Salinomyces thailandicus TaxID=706561 RepID=A0A4U0U2Q9_9PEZI|nr:hypothetical protein B0A50_03024 [Salinomyces thailandica]